ncbi:hypothetical protein VPH35_065676 [Triticum aestivum]
MHDNHNNHWTSWTHMDSNGQGGEPAVREEAEAVRHKWCPAAQEGPPPVRQVAQGHPHPALAPHPQIAPQGPPCAPPVHPHPQQEPRCWPSFFKSWVHRSSRKKNPEEKPHPTMRLSSLELVMCIFSSIL